MDGRGYFRNLTGNMLSTQARILPCADQLDALSAERPYRAKLPAEKVLAIMREERGKGLWPEAVDVITGSDLDFRSDARSKIEI